MTAIPIPFKPSSIASSSEDIERRGECLRRVWERDVLSRHDDPLENESIIAEMDEVLQHLPAFEARLASIRRPAEQGEVAEHLIAMRLNFHNSKASGEGYARIISDRVNAQQPSFGALEWATRDIIDRRKFMPVTAEILEAIASAECRLGRLADIARTMPDRRARLAALVNR